MKKVLFVLVVLLVGGARADNIITSREYVDTQANTLQTTLPAKNTNTVLLNTDTAGEVGEKAIYDASADYATQSDSLVTAGTFNTAVQNALESEFVCVERNDQGCLLYEIRGGFQKSKNLFDVSKIVDHSSGCGSGQVINNSDGSFTITSFSGNSQVSTCKKLYELAPDLVVGKTYRLSFDFDGTAWSKYMHLDNKAEGSTNWDTRKTLTIEAKHLDSVVYFYPDAGSGGKTATISNIQIEEGKNATSYVPYGNVYLPQN